MKFKVNVTKDVANKLHEANGILYWKENPCKNKKAGDIAGAIRDDGYIQIKVDGTIYLAHRIVWFIYHGVNADKLIDHINRNPSDNRIENLRLVCHSTNMKNSSISINNTSGTSGVDFMKSKGKFRARITIDGISSHLGLFDTLDDAVKARKNAQIGTEYTSVHGTINPNKKYKDRK